MKTETFKIGDKVLLPFDEEGIIVNIRDIIWGHKYLVSITKNTISDIGEVVDFKEEQITLLKKNLI